MVTIHFMPYSEIASLSSIGRIRKVLNVAKQNKIVLLEGRLRKEEEAELIKTTMEEINKEFRGIELAVIGPQKGDGGFSRARVASMLLGDRSGFTVVGPSSVVKAISQNPNKIELYTYDSKKRKRR